MKSQVIESACLFVRDIIRLSHQLTVIKLDCRLHIAINAVPSLYYIRAMRISIEILVRGVDPMQMSCTQMSCRWLQISF